MIYVLIIGFFEVDLEAGRVAILPVERTFLAVPIEASVVRCGSGWKLQVKSRNTLGI
jgi:hypothetical protein